MATINMPARSVEGRELFHEKVFVPFIKTLKVQIRILKKFLREDWLTHCKNADLIVALIL